MKYTLQYITSIIILLSFLQIGAQEEEIKVVDSIKYTQKYGLRIGVDFSKLVRTAIEEDYSGIEINGDFRITNNFILLVKLVQKTKQQLQVF